MPRRFELALTIALAAVPLAAQDRPTVPPQSGAATPAPPPGPVTETAYREARSLTLFHACDRSADDRLDLFEFAAAFIDLANPRDPAVFRRLDTDASGFLEWPEFDARFRLTIERAGRIRLQPARACDDVRDPTVPPPPVDPTEQIVGQFDVDRDGALSKQEFRAFVQRADLDQSVVERFSQIDTDQNGTLSVPEFSPVLLAAPSIWQRIAPHEQEIRAMPAEFRAIDLNLDGAIDHRELDLGLRRIHPALSAWTGRVLYDADRSRDKTLGWSELAAAATAARRPLEDR